MKFSAAPTLEWMALIAGFFFAGYYPKAMMVSLVLTALLGGIYWIKGYRRMGTGADIPVTKIASAAQGRVGLCGRVRAGKELLYTPISRRRCVWYSYSKTPSALRWFDRWWNDLLLPTSEAMRMIERWWYHSPHTNASMLEIEQPPAKHESEDHFYIEDDSGQCLINPRRGEFSIVKRDVVHEGRLTHIERWLPESALVTVFGDFRTLDTGAAALNRETRDVIQRWRGKWLGLLDRFDSNGDGTLDQAEWEKVRQEAAKEAHKSINISRHTLSATDEQPLYVFEGQVGRMKRRYGWWASAQFMVLIGSIIALATTSWWLPTVNSFSASIHMKYKIHF